MQGVILERGPGGKRGTIQALKEDAFRETPEPS